MGKMLADKTEMEADASIETNSAGWHGVSGFSSSLRRLFSFLQCPDWV
jgi:hypothetical protein